MSNRITLSDEQFAQIKKVQKLHKHEDINAAAEEVVRKGISRVYALDKYAENDEKPAKTKKVKAEKPKKKKVKAEAAAAEKPKKKKKKIKAEAAASNGESKPKKKKKLKPAIETVETADEELTLN